MKYRILPNSKFDQIGKVGRKAFVKYLNHFNIPRDDISLISFIEIS